MKRLDELSGRLVGAVLGLVDTGQFKLAHAGMGAVWIFDKLGVPP